MRKLAPFLLAAAVAAPTLAAAQATKKPAAAAPAKPSTVVPLPPPPTMAPPASAASPTPDLRPAAPAAPAPAKPKQALRLAMPDVKVTGDLPPRQTTLFETSLLAEVRKLDGVSAIGMSEIREMLSFEYQRQMLGCQADEACLAEIGGALGTDEMVHAAIIVEGKTANLTLKRINMRTARVTGTHTKRLTRANGEELLSAVGPAVQELFQDRTLRPGMTRGVDKAVALRLNPPPLPKWPFYATATAALAAVGGGAVMGYLSKDAQNQYNSLAQRALTESVPGAQLKDLETTAKSRAKNANLLFVVGGVLGVGAGVEALFTDWHGYRAQVDVGPRSGGVSVGKSF
ncbi:MAG: hypothetical protein U0229_05215 [Anaeromyxobacter sp.]